MAPRASWKGFLNLSLVSVPVKAYSASNTAGEIHLNQLHSVCHSRINLKTVCPNCGDIPRDEIVKGYEYAKGQYVVIDLDELEKLRMRDESKSVRIDTFIRPDQIDPLHYAETSYFLLPDGPPGQKAYALLLDAMRRKQIHCVARVVLHNKEHLVLLRPVENLLCMTSLKYSAEVKATSAFADEIVSTPISAAELALAESLIDNITAENFDLSAYRDEYTVRLTDLIQAKVEGREIVEAPAAGPPQILNLLEALKASVAQVQATAARPSEEKSAASTKDSARPQKTVAAKEETVASQVLADVLANPSKKPGRKKKSG